jgi:hypothetical protein
VDLAKRIVRKTHCRNVGPGDTMVLDVSAIHAVTVEGAEPTFHLHLYVSPIASRREFASRCHQDVSGPSDDPTATSPAPG